MKKILSLIVMTLLLQIGSFAQQVSEDVPAMADGMRADGKIWVVVAVVLTILVGLVIYLVTVDKKVSRLEEEVDSLKA